MSDVIDRSPRGRRFIDFSRSFSTAESRRSAQAKTLLHRRTIGSGGNRRHFAQFRAASSISIEANIERGQYRTARPAPIMLRPRISTFRRRRDAGQ
ncbi:MAG: hypothetical protein EA385_01040 [Salinarimonadaceae bacterium]|nr:MAG: hypothetical protein EA385_01040 [Salinarimonadaceae bacterium]